MALVSIPASFLPSLSLFKSPLTFPLSYICICIYLTSVGLYLPHLLRSRSSKYLDSISVSSIVMTSWTVKIWSKERYILASLLWPGHVFFFLLSLICMCMACLSLEFPFGKIYKFIFFFIAGESVTDVCEKWFTLETRSLKSTLFFSPICDHISIFLFGFMTILFWPSFGKDWYLIL